MGAYHRMDGKRFRFKLGNSGFDLLLGRAELGQAPAHAGAVAVAHTVADAELRHQLAQLRRKRLIYSRETHPESVSAVLGNLLGPEEGDAWRRFHAGVVGVPSVRSR